MLCLSYHCLCLLFNKIEEECRTGSTLKQGEWGEQVREMAQTMYANMKEMTK
jgi:hypothetical protein